MVGRPCAAKPGLSVGQDKTKSVRCILISAALVRYVTVRRSYSVGRDGEPVLGPRYLFRLSAMPLSACLHNAWRQSPRLPSCVGGLAWALPVLLFLVPIWSFRYLPTQDGPAHLANSLIVKG